MLDLAPLVLFGFAALFICVVALCIPQVARRWSHSSRIWLLAACFVVAAAPFVVLIITQGDPDVWDFYRSAWWIPAIVEVALLAWAVVAYRRSQPERGV